MGSKITFKYEEMSKILSDFTRSKVIFHQTFSIIILQGEKAEINTVFNNCISFSKFYNYY